MHSKKSVANDNLYKYRSLDGSSKENTKKIIVDGLLYFSSFTEFNDPFECMVNISVDATEAEARKAIYAIAKSAKPNATHSEIKNESNQILKVWNRKDFKFTDDHKIKLFSTNGILCLTKKCDNILMWSHYSDNHNGICIGFNYKNQFFSSAKPVTYQNKYVTTNMFTTSPLDRVNRIYFTKSKLWSYEEEWRLIIGTPPGVYQYPRDSIREIIFGCKTPPEQQAEVISWCREKDLKIYFRKAHRESNKFSLRIEDI